MLSWCDPVLRKLSASRNSSPTRNFNHPSSQKITETSAQPLELDQKRSRKATRRGLPLCFSYSPTAAGAQRRRGRKGPLFTQSSRLAAAVRTSHGPAGPAPPSSNSPQSSHLRKERLPGRIGPLRLARLRRASQRLRGNSHGSETLERRGRTTPAPASRQVSAQLTCFFRATAFPPLGPAPPRAPARSRDESSPGQPD